VGDFSGMDSVHQRFSSLSPSQDARLLIKNTNLLAATEPGGLLSGQDIFIVGKRVQEVGATGTLHMDLTQEMTIIRGEERLAIPGLINAHTHSPENLLNQSYRAFASSGVMAVAAFCRGRGMDTTSGLS
jgi:imidazolonepropionase-like amidohydrolase